MASIRPVTLRDIAQTANVSVATVSYVLSGKGRMSADTRRQIERLLREAGLRPRYKRYPVVYVSARREFNDMQAFNPLLQIYDGLSASFRESDVALRMEFIVSSGAALRQQLPQLFNYRVGGVVLDSNLRDDLAIIAEFFAEQKAPVVQIGHIVRAPAVDAVIVDSFTGAYNAVKHLIAEGHRRIATIRWDVADDPASGKKHAGYVCALQEAGLAAAPELIVESPHTREGDELPGRVAVDRLLALRNPPTAVFVENSFVSPSLMYTINESERGRPKALQELDVVHFEAWHLEWVEQVMAGKLAYQQRRTKLLRISWDEIGRVAARRLVERMEGLSGQGEVIQLVPKLVQVQGDKVSSL